MDRYSLTTLPIHFQRLFKSPLIEPPSALPFRRAMPRTSPADSGSGQRQRRSARPIDAVPRLPHRSLIESVAISIHPRPSGRNKHRSQSRNAERFGAPRRPHPYPPTSSIEDPPEADSGMGQNFGGHRRARVAPLHRRAHVCLFYSVSRIGTRSTSAFWYRRTLAGGNFASRCFKTDQTTIPVPAWRIKEEFCCSGDLQAFPAAASGKHPRPQPGDRPSPTRPRSLAGIQGR
jgi:hypothetical protein